MKQFYLKSLFLSLFCMIGTAASAYDAEIDGIYYNLNETDKTAEITRGNNEYADSVTIPSSVEYEGVSYSVTGIGQLAFNHCTRLTSVNIPNSVISIGKWAFLSCTCLTSITIPNSVTSIGNSAFEDCTGLTSLNIPNSVTSIGNSAFRNCTGLTSVTIPNSVTSIGNDAFCNCTNLNSITIPNSVNIIGDYAFFHNIQLKDVYSEITEPFIITNTTFSNTEKATLHVPSSTKSKYKAIDGWKNFKTIVEMPCVVDGVYYELDRTNHTAQVIENPTNKYTGAINISSTFIHNDGQTYTVTSIGNFAFSYCTDLTSITIPNSVISIGESAFQYCTNLPSITIPNSVTNIGDYAFRNCSGLRSITVPNSVTNIGKRAFENCGYFFNSSSSVNCYCSITLPDSIKNIGQQAFNNVSSVNVHGKSITLLNVWGSNSTKEERTNDGKFKQFPIVPYSLTDKKSCPASELSVNATQTKIVLKVSNRYDEYTYSVDNETIKDSMVISGLHPGQELGKKALTVSLGEYQYTTKEYTIASKPITQTIDVHSTPTSVDIKGKYIEGDINVVKENIAVCRMERLVPRSMTIDKRNSLFWIDSNTGRKDYSWDSDDYFDCYFVQEGYRIVDENNLTINHLNPGSTLSYVVYRLTIEYDDMERDSSIAVVIEPKTTALTLTTLQPKVATQGNVIVAAQSNIEDDEENVGFEWRRTDWTDDFKNNEGAAYLYEGMMEGYIRNLSTDKLWKYRPYYESKTGSRYYGDWMGLDPTNTSYFEPTVHTYASVQVNGNTVQVRGYAMRGSDETSKQGFKYWKTGAASVRGVANGAAKAVSVPKNAQTVEAKGNKMEAELKGLDYDSEYGYVAFVTTFEGETFYGEQQTLKTGANPNSGTTTEDLAVQIPASGYATFYSAANAYTLPTGFAAKVVTGVSNNKIIYETIADGSKTKNVVPAGVPVMLEYNARRSGTCKLTLSEQKDKYTGTNLLEGTDVKTTIRPAANEYAYKLSYGPSGSEYNRTFGWYWGAADGAGFEIGAHKAWLKVKKANGTRSYAADGEALGIDERSSEVIESQMCYDLQGRRNNQPTRKGLYIVNGKKMIKK